MTWAFFSDVHGNREALEAVVEDFARQGVTRSFFLGDAVGYGASPNECVKIISELTAVRLLGNHDWAVLQRWSPDDFNEHARAAIFWTRNALTEEARTVLKSFAMEQTVGDFHLVHASPHKLDRWDYILDPFEAEFAFNSFTKPVCLIGHTHQPLIFRKAGTAPCSVTHIDKLMLNNDARYLVNIGSVGQPRDGDPRACYVLYDPDTRCLRYRRVKYGLSAAQERIRRANLPAFLAARLEVGR